MTMMTRFFALTIMGTVMWSGIHAVAGGPRTLLTGTLTAAPGAPTAAKGKAKFDSTASRTNFTVEAQGLARLNGQSAHVFVDGRIIAGTVISLGRLKFELSTQRGDVVPPVGSGSLIEIQIAGEVILAGRVR